MHRQTIKSFEKLKNDRFDQIYWIHIREKYDVAGAVIRSTICVLEFEITCLRWGDMPNIRYCVVWFLHASMQSRSAKRKCSDALSGYSGQEMLLAFTLNFETITGCWCLIIDSCTLILHHMLRRISLHDSALNHGCSRMPRYWQLTSLLELMVLI